MRRVVLSLLAALLLVAAFAIPVAAAKPTVERDDFTEVFLDEFLTDACGFDVWITVSGHAISRVWTDAEGNFVREVFNIGVVGSMTAGSATLHFVDAGMDKATALPGGGVQVEIHGNLRLVTVKGKGPVIGATGRFVFQETPVLDEEGNPVLDEEGNPVFNFELIADSGLRVEENLEALCAVLAPAP
ncbi:MAG: hypothetical protein LC798_04805 [Chloroflexi bacterium]|nr:hypothetical protein [Chloroflexota bacterium]